MDAEKFNHSIIRHGLKYRAKAEELVPQIKAQREENKDMEGFSPTWPQEGGAPDGAKWAGKDKLSRLEMQRDRYTKVADEVDKTGRFLSLEDDNAYTAEHNDLRTAAIGHTAIVYHHEPLGPGPV